MLRMIGLAMFALVALPIHAQDYSLRVWRTLDGLPQNRIQALAQTPDGYLWIGTPAGLARFDGSRFTTFDRANTPALTDDSILSLFPARGGGLWIGTEGGGLVRMASGEFSRIGPNANLTNGFIRALLEDPQDNLWIGTDRGFFLRSPAGSILRLDRTKSLPEAAVLSLRLDSSGIVWAASNQGTLRADPRGAELFRSPDLPFTASRAILPAPDGTLWLSRRGEVWRISPDSKPVIFSLGKTSPYVLHQTRDGQIWIGTIGSGLLHLNGKMVQPAPIPDLPDQTVLTLLEDRDHSLWAGTQDGLVRITRRSIQTLSSPQGLANDSVSTISTLGDASIWIGTITGEMSRIANPDARPTPVPPPSPGFRPRSIFRDSRGDLWFGSSSDGVAHVSNGQTRTFTRQNGLRTNSVRQIFEDKSGRIWVALGSGLAYMDQGEFHTLYLEDGLPYGSVRSLLQLPGGDVLVATDGGVGRLRGLSFVSDPVLAPLRSEKVWTLVADPVEGVWLGTRGAGLFLLRQGKLSQFTVQQGLPGNHFYQLLDDQKGKLWMTGSFGIASVPWKDLASTAQYPGKNLSIVPFGPADGLESTEMNGGVYPAAAVGPDGDLWFATVKGAVRINPALARPSHLSQVLIEEIRADDTPYSPAQPIRIPADQQRIQISFTACDLLSVPHVKFRYKLQGFDSTWRTDSERRTAVYTNLSPGNYTFRVASLGTTQSESSIAFEVLPHFYQTSLFLAVVVLLVSILIWASFQLYARSTRNRLSLLFAERTRLAREMHDTVIQGCVGVSTLLEAAAAHPEPERGQDLVNMARQQVRLTLDEARQAVWDLRHKEIEGDLSSSLRDFASRFSAESPVSIGLEISGSKVHLDGRAERNLLLVAREAIRNALSHAAPAHIHLHLRFEATGILLEVRDDGKGFEPSPEPQSGHYGIVGMRERVAELGGSLEIQSQPGHGTSLFVRMPLGAHTA